jgi:hypothetical protein
MTSLAAAQKIGMYTRRLEELRRELKHLEQDATETERRRIAKQEAIDWYVMEIDKIERDERWASRANVS